MPRLSSGHMKNILMRMAAVKAATQAVPRALLALCSMMLPIAVMGYLAQGSLGDSLGLAQMHALLTANGWTWTTAVSAVLFFLLHWPCSTTLWTIRRETGSTKWTLLAALLPTAMGMALCTAFTALVRALGW